MGEEFRAVAERLKAAIVAEPARAELRLELAELYRAHGYPDQAGRWGALEPGWATDEERQAFASLFPPGSPVTSVARVLRVRTAEVPEAVMADVRSWARAPTTESHEPVTLGSVVGGLVAAAIVALALGAFAVFVTAAVGLEVTVTARVIVAIALGLGVLAGLLWLGRAVARRF